MRLGFPKGEALLSLGDPPIRFDGGDAPACYSVEASLPTAEQARLLHIEASEACLSMMRRTVSGHEVASVVWLVYPGSRYRFSGAFQP